MILIYRWHLGHCLRRFTAPLWPSDQNVSVWIIVPTQQLLDPSRTYARRWWGDHFDDVVINELDQRGSIVDRCFVPPHDPIIGREVTFNPVLRYDPIEYLIGSRAERNTITTEGVSALQQNAAPVALAKRRRILVARGIVEATPEPRLGDLEIREFRIL